MGKRMFFSTLIIAGVAAVGVAKQDELLQLVESLQKPDMTYAQPGQTDSDPSTGEGIEQPPAGGDSMQQEDESTQIAPTGSGADTDTAIDQQAEGTVGSSGEGEDVVVVSNVQDVMVVVNKRRELPADYVPSDLVQPDIPFSFEGEDPKKLVRQEVARALEELFAQAAAEQIELAGVSGYRSYARQQAIFNWNAQQQGAEVANKTSAVPGQSEHQTGLAIDVSSASVGYALEERFGETKEGKWLAENAPKFGFIIRYPKGKEEITGYSYEPWHLRYVGKKVAQEISDAGLTLEEYLGLTGTKGGKTKG
ncbi:M15 family metallopeptidase [Brevibacillus humidisoli]|uniref:M15 family metallopeptidase n=1 Tax=Brevibacillus humidisoli TaxID=2895522 RepID=UPI001E632078|nr:M15 family metallopeptidase [Brevibacillus humidisoli]UFJ42483.1 M15 family metallopeptidase [Brevibacillus humidisoli]